MCLYSFLLLSLKKEKEKQNNLSIQCLRKPIGGNQPSIWKLHWILGSIAFVSLSKEVFACWFLCEAKSFKCFVSVCRYVSRKSCMTFPKSICERRSLLAVLSWLLPTINPSARAHFTEEALFFIFPLVCQGFSLGIRRNSCKTEKLKSIV